MTRGDRHLGNSMIRIDFSNLTTRIRSEAIRTIQNFLYIHIESKGYE